MNADHALLKDFMSRVPRSRPDMPSIAVPEKNAVSGQISAMMPRVESPSPPEFPEIAKPVAPEKPELVVPDRQSPVPTPAMPTFGQKERAANTPQVSMDRTSQRDTHGDLLREIRDALGVQTAQKNNWRGMPSENRLPDSMPFGHLLR